MSKNNSHVLIIDYGIGNLLSIERALRYIGTEAVISDKSLEVATASRVILPGVGAFGQAMDELKKRNLIEAIKDFVFSRRPLLGICLGMQLLLTESYEFGLHQGLDLIQGKVARLQEPDKQGQYFKIPHIGWNTIEVSSSDGLAVSNWDNTVLDGIQPGTSFYFVHSFICKLDQPGYVIAESVYGGDRFSSVVANKNVWGCQFHPEKSGPAGLRFLKNFCNLQF